VRRTVSLVFSLTAMVFILSTTAISHSFGAERDGFIALKLGIYEPQEEPIEDFDTGINGEISVGGYITPNFALELGVGYFESDGPGAIVIPGPVVIPADAEFFVIPVTLNLKYIYPLESFEPYIEGGGGIYVGDAELSGGGIELSDRYTNVGGFLGAGVNINITESIFIGVEGRYLWVAEHNFELGETIQSVEMDGYTATANIGYRFSTDWGDEF
jgi:outer membrane protein W